VKLRGRLYRSPGGGLEEGLCTLEYGKTPGEIQRKKLRKYGRVSDKYCVRAGEWAKSWIVGESSYTKTCSVAGELQPKGYGKGPQSLRD